MTLPFLLYSFLDLADDAVYFLTLELCARLVGDKPGGDVHYRLYDLKVVFPKRRARLDYVNDHIGQSQYRRKLYRAVELDYVYAARFRLVKLACYAGNFVATLRVLSVLSRKSFLDATHIRHLPILRSNSSYTSGRYSSSMSLPAIPMSAAPLSHI